MVDKDGEIIHIYKLYVILNDRNRDNENLPDRPEK